MQFFLHSESKLAESYHYTDPNVTPMDQKPILQGPGMLVYIKGICSMISKLH